ncbi:universal stress protein [Mycolicibacterium celeriflavum]|uniref:universal stress protein n=1 Tax=Mycolicibacterium celeriflavum TaxID=1249101 RepID=UPI0007FFB0C6|nr:universal stress protein [Mycolicibacterium celeriflavum]OBG17525.1 universal stress protein [Mycolicibacterium celeriflavum]
MATATKHHGILVAIDGSPAAKVAVDWAAREAAMHRLPLCLIHVIDSPSVPMWPQEPMPLEPVDRLNQRGRDIIEAATETAKNATAGEDLAITTELVTARVLPTLVDLSKDAHMIVVGCRGLGAIRRRLLGSVSWGLLHHAKCPVAVIHDEDPLMPQPISKAPVVVGIDGSPASELATAIAFDEASRRGVELAAVHAWSDMSGYELPGCEVPALRREAEVALGERLAGWQEQYPDVKIRRVVVMDRPAHQLLEQSDSAQLTVLGSHGRGGFAGMLLGSVSSAVAEAADGGGARNQTAALVFAGRFLDSGRGATMEGLPRLGISKEPVAA